MECRVNSLGKKTRRKQTDGHTTGDEPFVCLFSDRTKMEGFHNQRDQCVPRLAQALADLQSLEEAHEGGWEIYQAAWDRILEGLQKHLERVWEEAEGAPSAEERAEARAARLTMQKARAASAKERAEARADWLEKLETYKRGGKDCRQIQASARAAREL
jgi:hypothetical protein